MALAKMTVGTIQTKLLNRQMTKSEENSYYISVQNLKGITVTFINLFTSLFNL